MSLAGVFDSRFAAWKDSQDTPWARLRYSLVHANISRYLDRQQLRVLDAGGGNGLDALPLAALGHRVTLLDFSEDMLADARHNADIAGVAATMTFHHADVDTIPVLFPPQSFDLVLCHNVLPYVADVARTLHGVLHPLTIGGLISVVGINRYSEPYRAALQQRDLAAASAKLDADAFVSEMFGIPLRRFVAEDITALLASAGCTVVGQYGVRCITDYLDDPDHRFVSDPEFFARLEQLELAMADRYPYRLLARFFQVIARKS